MVGRTNRRTDGRTKPLIELRVRNLKKEADKKEGYREGKKDRKLKKYQKTNFS